MPDTPFKAMGREKPRDRPLSPIEAYCVIVNDGVKCEKCGGMVYEGDWPWCSAGRPETHKR